MWWGGGGGGGGGGKTSPRYSAVVKTRNVLLALRLPNIGNAPSQRINKIKVTYCDEIKRGS